MKKVPIFTSIGLTFLLLLTTIILPLNDSGVYAQNYGKVKQVEQQGDLDFKILQENDSVIEYVITEDGEDVRVIMNFNSDRTEINSKAYKITNNSEELIRETNMDIGNESAEIETIDNDGKITTHTVGENKLKEDKMQEEENIEIMSSSNFKKLGPWKHSRTIKFREDIRGMTRDAIIATFVGVYWWPAGAAVTAYGLLKAANSNAFWFQQKIAFRYIKGTMLPRGERHIDRIYADKNLKHFIKGPQHTYKYVRGWEP